MFGQAERTREAHLLTVIGEAGIGKSRLAEGLADRLAQAATVLTGRCLSYGEGIAFWPLARGPRTGHRQRVAGRAQHSARRRAGRRYGGRHHRLDSPARSRRERQRAGAVGLPPAAGGDGPPAPAAAGDRGRTLGGPGAARAHRVPRGLASRAASPSSRSPGPSCWRPGRAGAAATRECDRSCSRHWSTTMPARFSSNGRAAAQLSAGRQDEILRTAEGNPLFVEQMFRCPGRGPVRTGDSASRPRSRRWSPRGWTGWGRRAGGDRAGVQ